MMGNKKHAKHKQVPYSAKEPKHSQNPEGFQNKFIAWHFQCMDSGGQWACSIQIIGSILHRLNEYEIKRWYEITAMKGNHSMPVEKIDPPAQKRINDIGYGDTENLYQLAIKNGGGLQRLWGLRHENVFKILWWDPKHTVYTTQRNR